MSEIVALLKKYNRVANPTAHQQLGQSYWSFHGFKIGETTVDPASFLPRPRPELSTRATLIQFTGETLTLGQSPTRTGSYHVATAWPNDTRRSSVEEGLSVQVFSLVEHKFSLVPLMAESEKIMSRTSKPTTKFRKSDRCRYAGLVVSRFQDATIKKPSL